MGDHGIGVWGFILMIFLDLSNESHTLLLLTFYLYDSQGWGGGGMLLFPFITCGAAWRWNSTGTRFWKVWMYGGDHALPWHHCIRRNSLIHSFIHTTL